MTEKWKLTKEDKENAKLIQREELIYPIDEHNLFLAGLYSVLSASEQHVRHVRSYNRMLENGLDTPDKIVNNKNKLIETLSNIRWPNTKIKRVYDYSVFWPNSNFSKRIIADIKIDRKDEFGIRNDIAEEVPGLWYKCASMFMTKCGYENIVPLDVWMFRYLKDVGYEIEVPDYKKRSGPKPKEYLHYEKVFSDIAKINDCSPTMFQFALWSKYSTWNKKK